jgi:catechol 2,3-dioxygenase-like lactoylglutathione lyase family enzyme
VFSHVFVGVNDFPRAFAFYDDVMSALGAERRYCYPDVPRAAWHCEAGSRPLFVIGNPFNGDAHCSGNGQMIAFLANSRRSVHLVYEKALKNGGTSEGTPGLRSVYHANFYGAYSRDPDGNKFCVVCHLPADEP